MNFPGKFFFEKHLSSHPEMCYIRHREKPQKRLYPQYVKLSPLKAVCRHSCSSGGYLHISFVSIVTLILLCPRIAWSVFGFIPNSAHLVAKVCLNVCMEKCSSPAFLQILSKSLLYVEFLIGFPFEERKTKSMYFIEEAFTDSLFRQWDTTHSSFAFGIPDIPPNSRRSVINRPCHIKDSFVKINVCPF